MTTFGAYDAGLPCKNPNCGSHGQPHPNCRCYGDMAEGGEVENFCSKNRPHDKQCQYFAEGGDTSSDFDPDAYLNAQPSQPAPSKPAAPSNSGFDPDAYLGSPSASDFDPDAFLNQKNQEQYGTPTQQAIAGVEGLAQGVAGPLATAAELGASKLGIPGVSAQDIGQRAIVNPATHALGEAAGIAGSLASGVGEAGLLAQGVEKLVPQTLGKVGSAALKGLVTNGAIQGGDEISKSLLGQTADPSDAVGAVLASAGLGALTGAAFTGTAKALSNAAEAKLGTTVSSILTGIGDAANDKVSDLSEGMLGPYYKGVDFYNKTIDGLSHTAASGAAVPAGYSIGGLPGAYLAEKYITGPLSSALKVPISAAGSAVVPAIMRVLSSDPEGTNLASKLYGAIDYANAADSGLQSLNKGIENLFQAGGQQAVNEFSGENERNKAKDFISNGGIQQNLDKSIQHQQSVPQFAEGGEVQTPSLAPEDGLLHQSSALGAHFPEQNIGLTAARGRISNYLTSMQPQKDQAKLAFDDEPDDRDAKKNYHKAIDLAINPLSILNKIKEGSIVPDDVKHFNSLHPELSNLMQKKLTERMVKAQVDGEKPAYHVRQGLSLLMGTPLAGELAPQNIQAAQAVFTNQAQQQAPGTPITKNKRNTSTLNKVSNDYLTPNQARTQDQQKQ